MIDRLDCLAALVGELKDELVVTGLGYAAFDTYAVGDRARNFYLAGALGTAASVAFGLAGARPDDRVICIDGDGSLLANLGSLATMGRYQPRNLSILVLDNQKLQITGGQDTHTAHGTDLAAIARGCGIAEASTVETLDDFRAAIPALIGEPGPRLVVAKVDTHSSRGYQPRKGVLVKYRFMNSIGNSPDVAALRWS